MRKTSVFIASLFLTTVFVFVGSVNAQRDGDNNFAPPAEQNMRVNLMRRLGLSKEQIQQIRKLNGQRGPLMQEAQRKLRDANRLLDQAIYADSVDDAVVEARLRDLNAAQAEVARIRALSELEIRKVLTPSQLIQFREIRDQFRDRREENMNDRRPMRRPDGDRQGPPEGKDSPRPLVNRPRP